MAEKKKIKFRNNPWILYGLTFVVLLVLVSLFPYSGDDWAWGSQIGLDRLHTWFDNYNGRYFGNLIVLALTRSRILRNFVMAGVICGSIALIVEATAKENRPRSFFLVCVCLAFMPIGILSSGFVWTSGFSNYATSAFLALFYLFCNRKIYTAAPKNSLPLALGFLILGFAGTLIVEHFTFYCVVLGVWVLFFCLLRYKKITVQHLAYFLGTIAGTVLMLSNSVYKSITDGTAGEREISSENGILYRIIANFAREIVPNGFLLNAVLNLLIAAASVLLFLIFKEKLKKPRKIIFLLTSIYHCIFAVISVIFSILQFETNILLCALTALYVLSLLLFIFVLPIDFLKEKLPLFVSLGSVGFSILPLFFVLPVGSRCFTGSYLFFLLFLAQLGKLIADYAPSPEKLKKSIAAFSVATLAGLVYLFTIYGKIYVADQARIDKAVTESQTQKTIYVQDLPYEDYVWTSSVKEEPWNERFKLFYGIDEGVVVLAAAPTAH